MFPEWLTRLFQSRKFWVLIAAVITAIGSYLGGLIDALSMVQAIIAALAVYSTGIAIVDSGAEIRKAEESRRGEALPRPGDEAPPHSGDGKS